MNAHTLATLATLATQHEDRTLAALDTLAALALDTMPVHLYDMTDSDCENTF
jgi:hypothetical protein